MSVRRVPVLVLAGKDYDIALIVFDHIDCSDSMNNFPHHMNFRKTEGFMVVEEVNLDGL